MFSTSKHAEIAAQMPRKYHILVVRTNGKWGVEFGSYIRSEVVEEGKLYADSRGDYKVHTLDNDTQEAIDTYIQNLNMQITQDGMGIEHPEDGEY